MISCETTQKDLGSFGIILDGHHGFVNEDLNVLSLVL
jgi:hypothetical protein